MIARACGLPENTVYIEDINKDVSPTNLHPFPNDGNTLIRHSVMLDDHLKYTFTCNMFVHKSTSHLYAAIRMVSWDTVQAIGAEVRLGLS